MKTLCTQAVLFREGQYGGSYDHREPWRQVIARAFPELAACPAMFSRIVGEPWVIARVSVGVGRDHYRWTTQEIEGEALLVGELIEGADRDGRDIRTLALDGRSAIPASVHSTRDALAALPKTPEVSPGDDAKQL